MISLKIFVRSFNYAWRGLVVVFKNEHSFRVHTLVFALIIVLICFGRLRPIDAAVLLFVAFIVLVLELVNSIFERFIDIVEPRVGAHVRDLKDIMAGAVLVASVGALAVGLIILIPYLL